MNLTQAATQYANRPADERFPSVEAMIANAADERDHSKEVNYSLKDLRFEPIALDGEESIGLTSPRGTAVLTNWAFGQTCRTLGAPTGYVRTLPPAIAADALNFGIREAGIGAQVSILAKAPNGNPFPTIRACTSDSYSRVWDADLYGQIARQIMDQDSRWTTPPTWSGEPAGAYRGDRDSFLVLTNGGSIVTDPSAASSVNGSMPGVGQEMYRGILVRNSEVGAAAITIQRILYRYICGNHIIWGAVIDKVFHRRHVGTGVSRSATREIANIAHEWANASAAKDQAIIQTLIDRELAATKEAVIDELRAIGYQKDQAEAAYLSCERTESVSPRSFWGIAQGTTRASQDGQYQNDRFTLDLLAAKVLARGAKLVTA